MQIDITQWTNEITNFVLILCLVAWSMARTIEVWLNVRDRFLKIKRDKKNAN